MIAFGFVTNLFQRGLAAWKRMLDVMDAEPAMRDTPEHQVEPSHPIRGRLEFRDLSFAYNGRRVLERVSARVEPGQILAVVGPTGSGKSTLLSLLHGSSTRRRARCSSTMSTSSICRCRR